MSETTFVDSCLAGNALPMEIDDWVDAWHDTDFGDEQPSLDSFLGFTADEGKLWAERPASLGVILAARKFKVGVADIVRDQSEYALAARSVSEADARVSPM